MVRGRTGCLTPRQHAGRACPKPGAVFGCARGACFGHSCGRSCFALHVLSTRVCGSALAARRRRVHRRAGTVPMCGCVAHRDHRRLWCSARSAPGCRALAVLGCPASFWLGVPPTRADRARRWVGPRCACTGSRSRAPPLPRPFPVSLPGGFCARDTVCSLNKFTRSKTSS